MLHTAGEVFEASNQRVSLTNMSGRRDMSLLLALSASQVPRWRHCRPASAPRLLPTAHLPPSIPPRPAAGLPPSPPPLSPCPLPPTSHPESVDVP